MLELKKWTIHFRPPFTLCGLYSSYTTANRRIEQLVLNFTLSSCFKIKKISFFLKKKFSLLKAAILAANKLNAKEI